MEQYYISIYLTISTEKYQKFKEQELKRLKIFSSALTSRNPKLELFKLMTEEDKINYLHENNNKKYYYKHLSYSERIKIEYLYKDGLSYREIGRRISRDKNTVRNEIVNYGTLNQPS